MAAKADRDNTTNEKAALRAEMACDDIEQKLAAARVVHDQCRKALLSHVTLERIRKEDEGQRVTLAAGFSASEVRLTGQVAGEPPFTGALTHAGWRAAKIELPKLSEGHDVHVIAPAEVEL